MDKCADITSAKMRDNKPKSVWVDTWKQLDKIDYRKETSEIIRHKIENDGAIIIVQSRICALNSYVDQKELFTLLHIDGTWLIDKLIVGDEVLEEQLDLLLPTHITPPCFPPQAGEGDPFPPLAKADRGGDWVLFSSPPAISGRPQS